MLNDQAAGLRSIHRAKPPLPTDNAIRIIAVASGKGGVGKTNLSVNLAISLSKLGNRVLLMDADMSLANVDIMLGIQTKYNLSHVLAGELSLKEAIVQGPSGISIIPASSGVKKMAQLSALENAGIINAFGELAGDIDTLIVDTAAGIADSVVAYCSAAQEVLIVVCDEPASITDAYALIKVLSREHQVTRFQLVANMSKTQAQAQRLYQKFARVCQQFLQVKIDYFGMVPFDPALRDAVQKQIPVTLAYPTSPSAKAFATMAQKLQSFPKMQNSPEQLKGLVAKLFNKS